jgi:hypothetical protein
LRLYNSVSTSALLIYFQKASPYLLLLPEFVSLTVKISKWLDDNHTWEMSTIYCDMINIYSVSVLQPLLISIKHLHSFHIKPIGAWFQIVIFWVVTLCNFEQSCILSQPELSLLRKPQTIIGSSNTSVWREKMPVALLVYLKWKLWLTLDSYEHVLISLYTLRLKNRIIEKKAAPDTYPSLPHSLSHFAAKMH